MNRIAVVLLALTAGTSQAALIDRGGGLIYDDVLNITWLQDANYAKTSGYNTDGWMTWGEAISWVANLEYYDSVRGVTYDDWRLPKINLSSGVGFNYPIYTYDGSSLQGWNFSAPGTVHEGSTLSELAHLFYNDLNNIAFFNFDGSNNPNWLWNVFNNGPFINLQYHYYTIDKSYHNNIPGIGTSWGFGFVSGDQVEMGGLTAQWAVRNGDVAPTDDPSPIPEPSILTLLLIAGLSFLGLRQKKR
jgi:hypothetical protein